MENNKTNFGLLAIISCIVIAVSLFINLVFVKLKIRKLDKETNVLKSKFLEEIEPEIIESKISKLTQEEIEAEIDRRINEME